MFWSVTLVSVYLTWHWMSHFWGNFNSSRDVSVPFRFRKNNNKIGKATGNNCEIGSHRSNKMAERRTAIRRLDSELETCKHKQNKNWTWNRTRGNVVSTSRSRLFVGRPKGSRYANDVQIWSSDLEKKEGEREKKKSFARAIYLAKCVISQ